MSNVVKFRESIPSPANPADVPDVAEVLLRSPGRIDEMPTRVRRNIRDIVLSLELAAMHLRRAAVQSDPNIEDCSEQYLAQAEELIEMARKKASEL